LAEETEVIADKTIDTVIDRLYDIVRAKRTTTAREVAAALSITEAQAEKLARLLESSKLVQLNYTVSETVIALPPAEPKAEAQRTSPEEDAKSRALAAACEDATGVKNLLEFSRRQLWGAVKKLEELPPEARRLAEARQTGEAAKRAERLAADAKTTKKISSEIAALADELQAAAAQVSGQQDSQKGAKTR